MFRNKEIRQFFVLFFLVGAFTVALSFLISTQSGVLSIFSTAILGIFFYIFTKTRYKNIEHIAEQIDIALHNSEHLYISEAAEGELSILQSEIAKLVLCIREQNDALKKEKAHLADSLADIAHQLRTPLTSANLVLSLLENESDKGKQKKLLRETEGLFIQMEWLINSLLKLSRLDAGIVVFQNAEININYLINTSVQPLLISMDLHNITLQTDAPHKMTICGDLGWLSEAIQNILKNCIQSIGDNGHIQIICENTLLFSSIAIHDSGYGFAKDDLPHLFDRFYRGKNERAAGYGIGLALCKMIISRHGGTIHAQNHPQGGALFYISFPK